MRLRCYLFGCATDEFNNCDRCGRNVYDHEYILAGWLEPLSRFWWNLKMWNSLPRWRCTQCGKWLSWRKSRVVSDEFCSMECFNKWIPF